jgi:hypothetical protein
LGIQPWAETYRRLRKEYPNSIFAQEIEPLQAALIISIQVFQYVGTVSSMMTCCLVIHIFLWDLQNNKQLVGGAKFNHSDA